MAVGKNHVGLNSVVATGTVITFQENHGFTIGDDDGTLVRYDAEDEKLDDSGLRDGNEYYVIVVDPKRLQLFERYSEAS